MKKLTLEFCGTKPVKTTTISSLRLSKEDYRKRWLEKVEQLGRGAAVTRASRNRRS